MSRLIVVWDAYPEPVRFFRVEDPELVDLFRRCHGLLIGAEYDDQDDIGAIARLERVMFGVEGNDEYRDRRVVPMCSDHPMKCEEPVTFVYTGIIM